MKKFIKKNFVCILLSLLLLATIVTYSIRTYYYMYDYKVINEKCENLRQENYEKDKVIDSKDKVIDSLNNKLNNDQYSYTSPNEDFWDPLDDVIAKIESNGNDSAIGKHGDYGALQIREIVVIECNNILKSKNINKKYVHEDAFDRNKAKEMFYIIADKYVPEVNHENPIISYEKMARIWNGGPNAYKQYIVRDGKMIENKSYINTTPYWNKVLKELKNQNIIS